MQVRVPPPRFAVLPLCRGRVWERLAWTLTLPLRSGDKKGGDPEDEEEAAEEERVVAEKEKEGLLVELDVEAVEELMPERHETIGEDGINENRPRHKGVERSVF